MKNYSVALLAAFLLTTGIASAHEAVPSININPDSAVAGTALTITGEGFNPGEPITIWFGSSKNNTPSSAYTYADSQGNFTAPITAPWISPGNVRVTAEGKNGNDGAWEYFTVLASNSTGSGSTGTGTGTTYVTGDMSLSNYDGLPGSTVTVYGSAFTPNSNVIIYFGNVEAGSVIASASGQFQTNVAVPNLVPGSVKVTSSNGDNTNPPTFTVDGTSSTGTGGGAPTETVTLAVSPTSGTSGDTITISGTGYAPNEQVNVNFNGTIYYANATNTGTFSTTLIAPTVTVGQSIAVGAAGQSSHLSASASFYDNPVSTVGTTTPPTGTPTNDQLQAEIVALQQEISALIAEINALQ